MKVDIRVTAQYYENYSDSKVPHWKAKGGREFVVEGVDADFQYYDADLAKEVLVEMVAKHSDSHYKYEYIAHEVIYWKAETFMDANTFECMLCDKQHARHPEYDDAEGEMEEPDLNPGGGPYHIES